ncbi:hypothetical protein GOBAR_AA06165 [Gossypium barbadense]|uniref:Uncharacterized protein n=1 Tax=Gossypium barbadense TaxID=3634 RepID=A0A2P5YFU3_GOSBA|nr:hypothetical protein GOBAR_AA06165 [Gossypium barbadense]
MSINSRNSKGEEIESNALPPVSSLVPSTRRGVLGTEAKEACTEMLGHVMGQWFDRYMGATPTSFHWHCDEIVRPEETMRMTKFAPTMNPKPLIPTIVVSKGDFVEAIRKRGAKTSEAVK